MFEEVKQTSAVSAVEPSLYQQIKDFFEEKGASMSKNFADMLDLYSQGNKYALFNLGTYFRFGNEETPKSPKLALLCLAECGEKTGHKGAMAHFCSAMSQFNLDELDLSSEQKEKFQELNNSFKEKLEEKEIECLKRQILLVEDNPEVLSQEKWQKMLARMKKQVAEYEKRHTPGEKKESNQGIDQGRY